jgi:hypothetical protein
MTEKFLKSLGQSAKVYGLPALLASLTTGGINAYLASESNPINETPSQRRRRLLKAFIQPAGITAALATALGVGKAIYDVNLSDVLTKKDEKAAAKVNENIKNGITYQRNSDGKIVEVNKNNLENHKTLKVKALNAVADLGGDIMKTVAEEPVEGAIRGAASFGGAIALDRSIKNKVINNNYWSKALKRINEIKENIREKKDITKKEIEKAISPEDNKKHLNHLNALNKNLSKVNKIQDNLQNTINNRKKWIGRGLRGGNALTIPLIIWSLTKDYQALYDPEYTGNKVDPKDFTSEDWKTIENLNK